MIHRRGRLTLPVWLELLVICVFGVGLGMAMNMARETPVPWVADFAALDKREALRRGLETVDVHAAKSLLGRPGVIFIDARTPEEYSVSHVAGAKSLPQEAMYGDLDASVEALGLKAEDRLVVYCGNMLCDRSKELGDALRTAGYVYVTVLPDGFEGWLAAGGPTEGSL